MIASTKLNLRKVEKQMGKCTENKNKLGEAEKKEMYHRNKPKLAKEIRRKFISHQSHKTQ